MQDTTTPPPTFSIITVTRNNLRGLEATQSSVLSQSCRDFEWIIIDGASSDNTPQHLQSLRGADISITAKSEADAGIYDAMNKGIKLSRGQYLLFLNAGDKLAAPDTLEKLTKATARNPDFIYGDSLESTGEAEEKPFYKSAKPARKILWGMFTHHQSMLYRREIIRNKRLRYRQIYPIAGDYDFTARFLKNAKKSLHIPIPVCIFAHGGVSQKNAFEGRRQQYIIRENLGILPLPLNLMVFVLQSLLWALRKHAPALYHIVRK